MEYGRHDAALAIELIRRLARAEDGESITWEALTVHDLDTLLLRIRQLVFGDLIRADITCPRKDCGKRIDIAFGVNKYLNHHSPRRVSGVEPASEAGWVRLPDTPISFRLPTGTDQLALTVHPDPEKELMDRCLRPARLSASLVRRVDRAMEAMAPSLAHDLMGRCPECSATVAIYFDPRQFILRELREQAGFVYEDIHLLAEHYHWREADILALPRERRIRYSEMVRASRSAA